MESTTFAKLANQFQADMAKLIEAKNHDYSEKDGDALSAFKDLAVITGLTPLQCWMVLAAKHVLAIRRFANSGELKSETIHERFIDLSNYSLLGDLVVKERECSLQEAVNAAAARQKLENEINDLRQKLTAYQYPVTCGGQGNEHVIPGPPYPQAPYSMAKAEFDS